MGEQPDERFHAEVEKNEKGGWEWRICNDEGHAVDAQGYEPLGWHDGLTGTTWMKYWAKYDARRALQKLIRYVSREEPEIIRSPAPSPTPEESE